MISILYPSFELSSCPSIPPFWSEYIKLYNSLNTINVVLSRLEFSNVSFSAITDTSLIAIAKNCTGLKYLDAYDCDSLSCDKLRDEFYSVSELRAVLLSINPSLPIWLVYPKLYNSLNTIHSKNNDIHIVLSQL
jgi:hypothetical protein